MGIIFFIFFFLSGVWYFAFYEILLRIERSSYRRNWEKDTEKISWLHKSNPLSPYSSRKAYDRLGRSWFRSTPAWVRDNRTAYFLIWSWRIGLLVMILGMLSFILVPILMDVLR